MRRTIDWGRRFAVVLALVSGLAAIQPGTLRAQTNPGGGGGNCSLCQYDLTDLENIIADCVSGYSLGASYCEFSGPWCINIGDCNSGEELHALDLSLFGEMVVTPYEKAATRAVRGPTSTRYLAMLSAAGTVPCRPATRQTRIAQVEPVRTADSEKNRSDGMTKPEANR